MLKACYLHQVTKALLNAMRLSVMMKIPVKKIYQFQEPYSRRELDRRIIKTKRANLMKGTLRIQEMFK